MMADKSDNRWIAVELIHAGEEEAALKALKGYISQGTVIEWIQWAMIAYLEPLKSKFGRCLILMMGVFF